MRLKMTLATAGAAWCVAAALLGGPAAAQNPLDVKPDAGEPKLTYPAWLKPGVRLTYSLGSGAAAGGPRMNEPGEKDAAGGGFIEVTIVGMDDQGIGAEVMRYDLFEAGSADVQSSTFSGVVGNAERLGEYWINPAILAKIPERDDQEAKIWRLKWRVGSKPVDAIAIMSYDGPASMRYVYELSSGLMIGYHSEVNPNGRAGDPGLKSVVNSSIVAVRETKLPWLNTPVPAGVRKGGQFILEGQYGFATPGVPMMPGRIRNVYEFGDPHGSFVPVKQTIIQIGFNSNDPETSETTRCFGAAATLPVWIDPRTLAGLQPGQALDVDPITKHTMSFGGSQNNMYQLIYANPAERLTQTYDANGMLVGVDVSRKSATGSIEMTLRSVPQ